MRHSLLLTLALVLAPSSLSSAQGPRPEREALEVGELVASGGLPGDSLPERLATLGPAHVPALFEGLVEGRVPRVEEPRGPVTWIPLGGAERALLRDALLAHPAELADHLRSTRIGERARDLALALLGSVGTAQDLELLVALAAPEGSPRAKIERGRRTTFQAALEGILERHPRAAFERLPALYGRAPDALLPALVWALGKVTSEERLWCLTRLLGRMDEMDPLILNEVARLGRALPHPIARAVLEDTRRALGARDPEHVLLAIDAVRSLEDIAAIPELIELLGASGSAIPSHAHEALCALTGQAYGRDVERWRGWQDKAREWRRSSAPRLLADVAGPVPGRASHALMEISKWRVFRHELAAGVARGLERPESDLVLLTCSVLGHLGSWPAIEPLARCLEDPELAVRRAAALALQRIVGRDLGSTPAPWIALARSGLQPPDSPAR